MIVVQRHLVGQLNALTAVGGTAGLQPIQGVQNGLLLVPAGRWQDQARGAGVDHHCHAIVLAQLVDEHLHASLEQGQLIGCAHRTGNVHQEHEVAQRPLFLKTPCP